MRLENLLRRIQGEYLEMPGLRLTPAQAQRLWGLTRPECESMMHVLVDLQFLRQTRDGAYILFDANSPVTTGFDNPERRSDRTPAKRVAA
jgi:hypothetical protein